MEWLASAALHRLPQFIAMLWMLGPTYLIGQAILGLWRRFRLLRAPVPVTAEVDEVWPRDGSLDDCLVVDLVARYHVDNVIYRHRQTKADHLQKKYRIGYHLELIHERSKPSNVIDATSRPWDDVIGPVVFSFLLFAFMGWVLLFVGGLQ